MSSMDSKQNEDWIEENFKEASNHIEIGRLEKALPLLEEILNEDPEHAGALNKMGVIKALQKNKEEARQYFEQSLQADRKNAPALTNLGNIYLENDNMHQAENLYNEALMHDPDYGPAHNNLAAIYKKKGQHGKMVGALKKARKAGSMSVDHSQKPIFLNPGCLVFLALVIGFLVFIFATQ